MKALCLRTMALCLSLFTLVSFVAFKSAEAQVTTQTCSQSSCHKSWLDNNVPAKDVNSRNATSDYLPLNLSPGSNLRPFYTIPQAYSGSSHATPTFDPNETDFVSCLGCHGNISTAHSGNIPGTNKCGQCHQDLLPDFSATSHANPNSKPGKFYDQTGNGTAQAVAPGAPLEQPMALFQANKTTIVTKNQRIEECSVCHNYALQYPRYRDKIAQGSIGTPQVGCSACHDAHIPAPRGKNLPVVDSTVQVTAVSGTTVLAVTPVDGIPVSYRNLKPYKLGASEAQNVKNGIWSRGSAFTGPRRTILQGTGTISNGSGTSDRLSFPAGGFAGKVEVHDTVFISGQAEATVALPADALTPGNVTVSAILDKAGFDVLEVIDGQTLAIDPGVVARATVRYTRTTPPGGAANFTVSIPFSGPFTFEVKNMNTNTETLCGSCHTRGKYKFTAWGKQGGKFIEAGSTHNSDVLTQYRSAGHANILAPAFEEFSARPYGTSHVTTYPFDMNITGSGGVGSLRNGGNTTFQLSQTPDGAFNNAFLSVAGNSSLPVLVNNYACFQCHNGLGAIAYLENVQGTSGPVLWGDATVTCVTCHDTHREQNGEGVNIRVPVKLSYNSRFVSGAANPKGGINKFMDGTDIPSNVGNGIICLFCHQGRESGLTVYMAITAKGVDPYTNPNQVIDPVAGVSFVNPHYLDSGAILWSRNAWEYFFVGVPQEYSEGIPAHQNLNCGGCHMAEASEDNLEGGHTWRPRVETCQACHGPTVTAFREIPAIGDYDGSGVVGTAFEEIGTLNDPVLGDSGLFGQLKAALAAHGITYDPDVYPYFFNAGGTAFTAWTTNTLTAAFNLSWAYKSGNCVPYHNAWYGAQILQDSLRALDVDTAGYFRPDIFPRTATDYRTIVVNP